MAASGRGLTFQPVPANPLQTTEPATYNNRTARTAHCPRGPESQTPSHILLNCPAHDALHCQTWQEGVEQQVPICWLLACLTSQQHSSVSQGRICSDKFTCYHTEIGVADQISTSPSHSKLTQGWTVSPLTLYHQAPGVPVFKVTNMTQPRKIPTAQARIEAGSPALQVDALPTRPTTWSGGKASSNRGSCGETVTTGEHRVLHHGDW